MIHSKYGNKKVEIDGFKFDSKKEAHHYRVLKNLQENGSIQNLKIHPRYDLSINGTKICSYIPDFEYINGAGELKTIDVKGVKTPVYQLKKKLMKVIHSISIIEV
jgi:hypothetical protein